MRPFLKKSKEDQTILDVLDYWEQLKGENRHSTLTGFPLHIRPPEDFFTLELIKEAEPYRIRKEIEYSNQRSNSLRRELEESESWTRMLEGRLKDVADEV